ncbi:hypothetical protein SOVF_215410 isoform A [Spinacia oleracea]|nr:hypothetical protein SOVF_215410 isoform A [Spinacia oleracea]
MQSDHLSRTDRLSQNRLRNCDIKRSIMILQEDERAKDSKK